MSALVGAYVCPRGAYFVEVRARRGGLEVLRSFEYPAVLASAADAARHIVRSLDDAGVQRAQVAVAVRGLDVGHHTLSLPPAPEKMLQPIITREIRRLEQQLTDPVVGWLALPDDPQASLDVPAQRHFIAAAMPGANAMRFDSELGQAGHTLLHLTALPAAVQRLAEDFDPHRSTTALLVPLPDGLFLGLFLGGGMRISIEPPLLENDVPDGVAMAEETELGVTYVRQQFRGAQVERAVIAGPKEDWPDTQSILTDRLSVPVERLDLHGLSAGSLVALGAVLDSRSPQPLSLGGTVANRRQLQSRATLRQTSRAAVVAAVVVAVWAVFQALDARRAHRELLDARRRVEVLASNVGPLRQTAGQRRLVRDATALLRLADDDRSHLRASLAALSGGVVGPVRMDSLHLERGTNGWVAALAGRAVGVTSGGAVQALHDFYRDLPRRLVVEELALGQMAYADTSSADGTGALIRFDISFVLPQPRPR